MEKLHENRCRRFPASSPRAGATSGDVMTPNQTCRVILAEDHNLLREGLRELLARMPGVEVVGEAVDGREAMRLASELLPDLVLLDLSMPRANGLEALKEIKRVNPRIKVLVLTVSKAEDQVYAVLQAGGDGYVLKDTSSQDLFAAIRSVLAGERYLSPAVATVVVGLYLNTKEGQAVRPAYDALSDREREVLKLVAEGHRSKEIAAFLCISPKTVEKHRANLMVKLNVHNISGLTAYAIEKGLVSA